MLFVLHRLGLSGAHIYLDMLYIYFNIFIIYVIYYNAIYDTTQARPLGGVPGPWGLGRGGAASIIYVFSYYYMNVMFNS